VIWRYLDLLSSKSFEEIKVERVDVEVGCTNILVVKECFVVEIITRFHDVEVVTEVVVLAVGVEVCLGHEVVE